MSVNRIHTPCLDTTRFFLGGDSAGAQIALQYGILQTNGRYANQLKLQPKIPPTHPRGVVSYCGVLDLKQATKSPTSNWVMHLFFQMIGHALTGTRKWRKNRVLEEVHLVAHVTNDFVSTYLTDGNTFSFSQQGLLFAKRLKQLKVPVTTLFFQSNQKRILHEYQFNYALPEAKQAYQQTIDFIKQYQ
ncbi:alpha/beta hydrolase [Enterococcus sp. LJL98]